MSANGSVERIFRAWLLVALAALVTLVTSISTIHGMTRALKIGFCTAASKFYGCFTLF